MAGGHCVPYNRREATSVRSVRRQVDGSGRFYFSWSNMPGRPLKVRRGSCVQRGWKSEENVRHSPAGEQESESTR